MKELIKFNSFGEFEVAVELLLNSETKVIVDGETISGYPLVDYPNGYLLIDNKEEIITVLKLNELRDVEYDVSYESIEDYEATNIDEMNGLFYKEIKDQDDLDNTLEALRNKGYQLTGLLANKETRFFNGCRVNFDRKTLMASIGSSSFGYYGVRNLDFLDITNQKIKKTLVLDSSKVSFNDNQLSVLVKNFVNNYDSERLVVANGYLPIYLFQEEVMKSTLSNDEISILITEDDMVVSEIIFNEQFYFQATNGFGEFEQSLSIHKRIFKAKLDMKIN